MSTPQGQPAAGAPPRGKTPLLVAVCGLALALGGVVAYQRTRAPKGAEADAHAKPAVVFQPTPVTLDPFVLNLADPSGDRFFRLNVRLVLDQRAIAERAAGGLAQAKLRDRILSMLAKKHATELTGVAGKEALRAQIQELTTGVFAEAPLHDAEHDPAPARVLDVLFTEFLVQ